MRRLLRELLISVGFFSTSCLGVFAATATHPCVRPAAGSHVQPPPDIYSQNGALNLALDYFADFTGAETLFCFKTIDGRESPTLHVKPGDIINISLTNRLPALPANAPGTMISVDSDVCGDKRMNLSSVNMHFHGTNTSPECHGDQVIHTLINSGETFQYSLSIPADEPSGLYWYHPHVHRLAEAAVLGGATGAIVVEGIEKLQPAVAGLPERLLIIRDQTVTAEPVESAEPPGWDISLNYVPVLYPTYTPAVIDIKSRQREFWRVLNASADTIMHVQLVYDGVPQPLQIVGLDGVPVGSQDGTRQGKLINATHIALPAARRAEFIISGPPANVKDAKLITKAIDTGPDGDNDPERPLAVLEKPPIAQALPIVPQFQGLPGAQRFEDLDTAPVTARRTLYFSEVLSDPSNPASPTNFYITVDGAKPTLFDPANPPAIVTKHGSVEDWTIENHSQEVHIFHIHQIHFEWLAENGAPVSSDQKQMLDSIAVPYWSGKGPYPSVTVRMDFRGHINGDFVYHCHILGHEDNGMMAIVRVLP